jgi:hypothetical protein
MYFHGTPVRQQALTLLRGGARNADVARRLQVPAGTIGYWLHQDRKKRGERVPPRRSLLCPICDDRPLDNAAYAYLLGLYLGDGHISHYSRHRTPSLMITLDNAWPGIQDEAQSAMATVYPDNATCRVRGEGATNIKVYSKHLPCLFPQHGPGKKHDRTLVLAPWQQRIVDEYPWPFIRGLIHSDGCRITNWTEKIIGGERKRYEYARYFFSNASTDILRFFTETLDAVGVEWKPGNQKSRIVRNISVARKASVALMDTHVGPKY